LGVRLIPPFTTMGTDYYKLLGIDKGAGEDEIKKAYKKMASVGTFKKPIIWLIFLLGPEMASR